MQIDLFADGSVNSRPPYLDPALVGRVLWRATVDRDHVGAAEVGRFGNNADCWVVEILGRDGATLWGERCESAEAATTLAALMTARIEANRQQNLF
jgi:hypothetical protein